MWGGAAEYLSVKMQANQWAFYAESVAHVQQGCGSLHHTTSGVQSGELTSEVADESNQFQKPLLPHGPTHHAGV